jgi:hypothetical protein
VDLEALQNPKLYTPFPVVQKSVTETNSPQTGESINRLAFHIVSFISTVLAVYLGSASTQDIMHGERLGAGDKNTK